MIGRRKNAGARRDVLERYLSRPTFFSIASAARNEADRMHGQSSATQIAAAIVVGLFQQVERGLFVAERPPIFAPRRLSRNIGAERFELWHPVL